MFFPPAERHAEKQAAKAKVGTPNGSLMVNDNNNKPEPTWIHEIFQGTLTNETRCLCCEGVSYSVISLKSILAGGALVIKRLSAFCTVYTICRRLVVWLDFLPVIQAHHR